MIKQIVIIFFILFAKYCFTQNDSISYLKIIKESNVLPIDYINKTYKGLKKIVVTNDSVFITMVLKENETIIEYDGIIVSSKFKLHGFRNVYENKTDIQIGKIIENNASGLYYYCTGDIENVFKLESTSKGFANGVSIDYNDGKIKTIYYFINDTLDGNYTVFYDNASIKELGQYRKNIRNGLYMEFYKDGSLKVTGRYSGNYLTCSKDLNSNKMIYKLNGKTKIDFLKNYSSVLKTEVSEGIKNSSISNFKYFFKEGTWEYYSNDGKLLKKLTYNKKGNIIDK